MFCPRFDAVPLLKEGHTRCGGERREPRAAFRRAGVQQQDRRKETSASRVTGGRVAEGRGGAVGLGAFLLLSVWWSANSFATESFRRGAKKMELWSTS